MPSAFRPLAQGRPGVVDEQLLSCSTQRAAARCWAHEDACTLRNRTGGRDHVPEPPATLLLLPVPLIGLRARGRKRAGAALVVRLDRRSTSCFTQPGALRASRIRSTPPTRAPVKLGNPPHWMPRACTTGLRRGEGPARGAGHAAGHKASFASIPRAPTSKSRSWPTSTSTLGHHRARGARTACARARRTPRRRAGRRGLATHPTCSSACGDSPSCRPRAPSASAARTLSPSPPTSRPARSPTAAGSVSARHLADDTAGPDDLVDRHLEGAVGPHENS